MKIINCENCDGFVVEKKDEYDNTFFACDKCKVLHK